MNGIQDKYDANPTNLLKINTPSTSVSKVYNIIFSRPFLLSKG